MSTITSGRLDFDNEVLSQVAEEALKIARFGSVLRGEHVLDRRFVGTGECREPCTLKAALTDSQRKWDLCGPGGGNGNASVSVVLRTWCREVFLRLVRPATSFCRASTASMSASASSQPEVRHSSKSRDETMISPVQLERRGAG